MSGLESSVDDARTGTGYMDIRVRLKQNTVCYLLHFLKTAKSK